jgi:hypothetical protein
VAANNYSLMNNIVLALFVAILVFTPTLARITAALVAQFVLLLVTTPKHQGIGPRRGAKNARRWREPFKLVSLAHFLGMGFSTFIVERNNMPCRLSRLLLLGRLVCFLIIIRVIHLWPDYTYAARETLHECI